MSKFDLPVLLRAEHPSWGQVTIPVDFDDLTAFIMAPADNDIVIEWYDEHGEGNQTTIRKGELTRVWLYEM